MNSGLEHVSSARVKIHSFLEYVPILSTINCAIVLIEKRIFSHIPKPSPYQDYILKMDSKVCKHYMIPFSKIVDRIFKRTPEKGPNIDSGSTSTTVDLDDSSDSSSVLEDSAGKTYAKLLTAFDNKEQNFEAYEEALEEHLSWLFKEELSPEKEREALLLCQTHMAYSTKPYALIAQTNLVNWKEDPEFLRFAVSTYKENHEDSDDFVLFKEPLSEEMLSYLESDPIEDAEKLVRGYEQQPTLSYKWTYRTAVKRLLNTKMTKEEQSRALPFILKGMKVTPDIYALLAESDIGEWKTNKSFIAKAKDTIYSHRKPKIQVNNLGNYVHLEDTEKLESDYRLFLNAIPPKPPYTLERAKIRIHNAQNKGPEALKAAYLKNIEKLLKIIPENQDEALELILEGMKISSDTYRLLARTNFCGWKENRMFLEQATKILDERYLTSDQPGEVPKRDQENTDAYFRAVPEQVFVMLIAREMKDTHQDDPAWQAKMKVLRAYFDGPQAFNQAKSALVNDMDNMELNEDQKIILTCFLLPFSLPFSHYGWRSE